MAGLPAPKVTIGTFSSKHTLTISETRGDWSIIFTPKSLEVLSLVSCIAFKVSAALRCPVPRMPKAPASDTADTRAGVATQAIPP
ncbi:MAG: hypothetical protein DDT40_01005 [candidate division WS2 bacterium]|nr:hypothetical protein [Candidatus Psychracetigena formicireducens]